MKSSIKATLSEEDILKILSKYLYENADVLSSADETLVYDSLEFMVNGKILEGQLTAEVELISDV